MKRKKVRSKIGFSKKKKRTYIILYFLKWKYYLFKNAYIIFNYYLYKVFMWTYINKKLIKKIILNKNNYKIKINIKTKDA